MIPQEADQTHIEYGFPVLQPGENWERQTMAHALKFESAENLKYQIARAVRACGEILDFSAVSCIFSYHSDRCFLGTTKNILFTDSEDTLKFGSDNFIHRLRQRRWRVSHCWTK